MSLSELSIQSVHDNPPAGASDIKDLDNLNHEPIQFPEGGTAAWCVVVGGALIQFCCFGYMSSFGVYQDFYTVHYLTDESSSTISWIGSTNAFATSALGLVSGALYDRGYCYHLLIGGSLLQSFSMFMLSLAQPGQYYQIFLAQGIALGTAQGILYVPCMAVVSHYFSRRRTLAMSLVVCGASIGAIVHPVMLNILFNRSLGFANGVRVSAGFVSLLLFIACLLVRPRLEPPKRSTSYLSVGKGILRDVPFCLMSIGCLCFNITFFFPLFYLQLDSVKHGNSETFSFYSLVFLNGGGLIGRLSAGFIAPRIGVPRLLTIAFGAGAITCFGMIGLSTVPTVAVLGILLGYFAGIYIALLSPIIALLTNDFSELGARMGIATAILGIGSLFGGPISGALLTSQYKWWQPAVFSGLIGLVACLLMVVMQYMLTCRKRTEETRKI